MEPLIDSHCHLTDLAERKLDWKQSCRDFSVNQVVAIGVDLDDSRSAAVLAKQSGVFFSVGWHPEKEEAPSAEQMTGLGDLLKDDKAVAVGEIGLDYFERPTFTKVPAEIQRRSFALMLALAEERAKPVVVHCRDAWDDMFAMLTEFPKLSVVMHCFTGDPAKAEICLDRGYMLSFAGILTFPNAEELRAATLITPVDHMLVETDAPYLTPGPLRGQVNLPGYVSHTAAALASLLEQDESELRAQLTKNTHRVFALTDEVLLG